MNLLRLVYRPSWKSHLLSALQQALASRGRSEQLMWLGGDGFSWPKEVPEHQWELCLGRPGLGEDHGNLQVRRCSSIIMKRGKKTQLMVFYG